MEKANEFADKVRANVKTAIQKKKRSTGFKEDIDDIAI
jgi:hypothetical protein